jgi:Rieske Fe-S protein
MTHGTIAGILIRDLVLGRENPWADLYDPARKRLRALAPLARRAVNAMGQFKEYVTPGDVEKEEEIPAGCGAIVRDGTSKLAVFVDEDGHRHRLSAVCPHMKCLVSWNPTERTWDCPCHGSRYDALGSVLMGPSTADLSPAE